MSRRRIVVTMFKEKNPKRPLRVHIDRESAEWIQSLPSNKSELEIHTELEAKHGSKGNITKSL